MYVHTYCMYVLLANNTTSRLYEELKHFLILFDGQENSEDKLKVKNGLRFNN